MTDTTDTPINITSCNYDVDCGYPSAFFEVVDAILHDALGSSNSSGIGFGVRDSQWSFATRAEAETAEAIILKIFSDVGFTSDTDNCYTGITHRHWNETWTETEIESLSYPDDDCS